MIVAGSNRLLANTVHKYLEWKAVHRLLDRCGLTLSPTRPKAASGLPAAATHFPSSSGRNPASETLDSHRFWLLYKI